MNKLSMYVISALAALLLTGCSTGQESNGTGSSGTGGGTVITGTYNTTAPATPVRLVFIHHSCGAWWLGSDASYGGGLGAALNTNNYYVSECYYGWSAETGDALGETTNTTDWPNWFNNTKMPYVYASAAHPTYVSNTISQPAGDNEVVMFKSCFPLSEVGTDITDEQAIYNSLLTYFAAHTSKLFVLITPPGETTVSSANLTRELCNWLVDTENGWLKDYTENNVAVYDFYCTLSETGSHHRIQGNTIEHVWDSGYDGESPYHTEPADGADHPDATGNKKATAEYIPLLNAAYNRWKGL